MKAVALELPQTEVRDVAQRLYEVERSFGQRLYEVEKRQAEREGRPVPSRPEPPQPPQDLPQRSPGAERERQRTLLRAIDELYFRVEIEPGQGALDGASVIDATAVGFNFEDFPAGANTSRRRNVRRRDLWPKTLVRMNVWYTSPVGSTATFNLAMRVRQLGTGMSLGTPALVSAVNALVPGPAVAGDILFATMVSTVALLPAPEVVGFSFASIVGGTNVNALRWILAEFVCQEVA